MKIYRVEIEVAATAYIVADSEARARELAAEHLTNNGHELTEDELVSGASFGTLLEADEEDVTLSPAITLVGPGLNFEVEEIEE